MGPPTLPRETSEKKRPTASMSASALIASDFRYSGKKPTARQDSLKVMRPDEGWVCEVEPANETQGPVIRSTLIGKGTPPSTYEGCATLYEIFERSVRLFPDNPCLGSRLTNEDGTPTDLARGRIRQHLLAARCICMFWTRLLSAFVVWSSKAKVDLDGLMLIKHGKDRVQYVELVKLCRG